MTKYYATSDIEVDGKPYEDRLDEVPAISQNMPEFVAGIEAPQTTQVVLRNLDKAITTLRQQKPLRGKLVVVKERYEEERYNSKITWTETKPVGTTVLIETNVSLDGGTTWKGWKQALNGFPVQGLERVDLSNAKVQVRQTLTTNDMGQTPEVSNLLVEINNEIVRETNAVYRGVIDYPEIGSARAVLNLVRKDLDFLDSDFPFEKITTAQFPDARDLDVPIPFPIGTAKKVPLALIKAFDSIAGSQYQYLAARGDVGIDVVYRDDLVLREYTGAFQSGSTATSLKLSAGDIRNDDFYNELFILITSGGQVGQVREVTDFMNATKIAVTDSALPGAPGAGDTYVIREWKKIVMTVQGVLYTGIEFAIPQKEPGTDRFFDYARMAADITGHQTERNPSRAAETMLTLAGKRINAIGFAMAASKIDAIGDLYVDGPGSETQKFIDVLNEVCLIGRMYLRLNEYREWEPVVDGTQDTIYGRFASYDNTVEIGIPRETSLADLWKTLAIRYRKAGNKDEYRLTTAKHAVIEEGTKDEELPFTWVHEKMTGDKLCDYLAKRRSSIDGTVNITLGREARKRKSLDLIWLDVPELNKTGIYQLVGERKQGTRYGFDAVPWDENVFVHSLGVLPSDPVTDARADFRKTPPDAVSDLAVAWTITALNVSTKATLTWTIPIENYKHVVVEYKKSSDSVYTVFGAITGTQTEIPGLEPGLNYDFRLQSANFFDLPGGVATLTNQLSAGDNTAPAMPTGLAGSAKGGEATWTFSHGDESDLADIEVEMYTASTGGTPLAPTPMKIGKAKAFKYTIQSSDLATTVTRWLRIRAIDHSGNASAWTARVSATSSAVLRGDIPPNEITKAVHVSNTGTTTSSPLLSGTINAIAGLPVKIDFRATMKGNAGIILSVVRTNDSAVLHEDLPVGPYGPGNISVTFEDDNPPVGNVTYQITAGNIPTEGVNNRTLVLRQHKTE